MICRAVTHNFLSGSMKIIQGILFPAFLPFSLLPGLAAPGVGDPSQREERTLDGVHGVRFGMELTEVVESIAREYGVRPSRRIEEATGTRLEYDNLKTPRGRVARLRLLVHPVRGLFWVDEEHILRWNLQLPDRDNLESHGRALAALLGDLRSRYGPERFRGKPELSQRFRPDDFVTASWRFPGDRWIHVIYEPQDWSLFPEVNTLVVIYRDSSRDPRGLRPGSGGRSQAPSRSPNSFSSSNL